jgi:stress response protein SCP2
MREGGVTREVSKMKVGDLVQNIRNPIVNKEAGEEMGIVVELSPGGSQFKIVLLGETKPYRNWKMVKTFEVIG